MATAVYGSEMAVFIGDERLWTIPMILREHPLTILRVDI